MVNPCVLCQGPATVYCCNDDASLCAECDVKFHSNPITARHDRRPIAATEQADRVSSFQPAESSEDLAVVPQCAPASPTIGMPPTVSSFLDFGAPAPAYPSGQGELSISDLLSMDDPNLLDFGMLEDFMVPDELTTNPFDIPTTATMMSQQHPATAFPAAVPVNPFNIQPEAIVPQAMVPQLITVDEEDHHEEHEEEDYDEEDEEMAIVRRAHHATRGAARRVERNTEMNLAAEPELTREQRVARYREKRARRNFKKTIRYQSRKAYAEIRPRIKGRFVSPEEYAAYMAGNKHDDVAVVPCC